MLEVDIALPLGGFALDARFATGRGITALFAGPVGQDDGDQLRGRAAAATARADRRGRAGAVRQRGGRGRAAAPATGRVRLQDARLFPHLSVRQNLLYGQRFAARGDEGHSPAATLEAVVDLLGVGQLLARRPGALSGGERQRVAIGRALLANPRLLLMDEPLASLDAPRKAEILPYLERLRDALRVPVVYVSHSLEEVTRLADSVVAMAEGRVVAAGPAAEVLSSPAFEPVIGRFEGRLAAHGEGQGRGGGLRPHPPRPPGGRAEGAAARLGRGHGGAAAGPRARRGAGGLVG
jgi:molybdate transport system ATP-binding protein